ncbi:hypothetical protein D3878_07940 [Noviherbaspirillum sedimenti]|uniref:TIGR04222 domain-containing membrane protein n=2 Tax=Noviherbaspirillum sedimenti TaxID=2320865 RepID=A0A3A3GCA3_9BURK|nr:hypothetical protein D3878_07940 [Noviherbaspirillum sedimenti]
MLSLSLMLAATAAFLLLRKRAGNTKAERISQFVFPPSIANKLKDAYPHLTDAQTATVMNGLREYFHISAIAERHMVSMPSKVVDVAWHEFILFTRLYHHFCRTTLGRYLHHTPSEAMRTPTQAQHGIKRAWRLSCKREGIDPKSPARLPLLFAMDAMLAIPDGYRYALNCQSGADYCASHIGCGSGCGGSSSADGCSSGSDGCGDGGGGCGGGGD